MNKKYWLMIVIFSVLVIAFLYWYLNYYKFTKVSSSTSSKETGEIEEGVNENIKSIELEKPPFIKE